jgi:aryl-alcohol dehydrogenase-like predicted oxidoreductase
VLTGKYTRRGKVDPESRLASSQKMQSYIDQDATWMLIEKLGEAAQSRKASISQVALGWLLQRESITSPIIGPRSLEQLEDNLGSIGLRLSDKELAEIDALTVDGPAA